MLVSETFKALGDPVRLEMIRRLSVNPRLPIGDLSDGLGLTRQGARKHLQVLAKVKLVSLHVRGRQTHVNLDLSALLKAKLYITEIEQEWDKRLLALRTLIEGDTRR